MSTVRASCLVCADAVHLPVGSVLLHRRRAVDVQGRYGFTCPRCDVFVVRHANAAVVAALLAADAPTAVGGVPPWELAGDPVPHLRTGEVTPPPGGHDLPQSCETEIRLFAAALEDDAALATWLAE